MSLEDGSLTRCTIASSNKLKPKYKITRHHVSHDTPIYLNISPSWKVISLSSSSDLSLLGPSSAISAMVDLKIDLTKYGSIYLLKLCHQPFCLHYLTLLLSSLLSKCTKWQHEREMTKELYYIVHSNTLLYAHYL